MMSLYYRRAASIYFHGKAHVKSTAKFNVQNKSYKICAYCGFGADIGVEAPIITKKKFEKTILLTKKI